LRSFGRQPSERIVESPAWSKHKIMAEFGEKAALGAKPNYLYSIVSVALVLFLLGFFGLIIIHAQRLVSGLKEKINVMVELKEGTNTEAVAGIEEYLHQSEFVRPGSAVFISKEEAAGLMRKDFGEDFMKLDLPNPLYDVITFNVRSSYMQPDSLEKIRATIREMSVVSDVYYQESLLNEISENIGRIGYIALVIGLFFLLVAVTLIHNTIRLALYSNRFLIKNMQLVGASWEFISRPYLMRSVRHGILSGLISTAGLALMLAWTWQGLPELKSLQHMPSFAALFTGLLLIGVLINITSTFHVVKKYLKMRVDDLY
jgi:cell division transport system permease protein